jgi:hypothetical protein
MNILLVEPGYKNKYPPLGLMKLSTYHKAKKDNIFFVKGIETDLPYELWDRVYITTLFTFYFDVTVKTVRYYKKFAKNTKNIYVGGILASLMCNDLSNATGLKNIVTGSLNNSKKIDYADNINIDCLTPDYDIMQDINYRYPAGDNYLAYTTRGCPNKCPFCAVPKLEPQFKTTNNIYNQIREIDRCYGQKRNLLLLDNNVLYSPHLTDIIRDIKRAGFEKKPNYVESHEYEIYLQKYNLGLRRRQDAEKAICALNLFIERIKNDNDKALFSYTIDLIEQSKNISTELHSQRNKILPIIQKYKNKARKQRYVDFNQGIDASLLNNKRMKILSEIPIRPLRIAFDRWIQKNQYEKAVRRASKYGIKDISNYLLYNYTDKPIDLWNRIILNIKLQKKLKVHIFSFPMKYSPVNEKDRKYIGPHWNRKFIRAIQAVLLVKKGIVSTKQDFVERAFGKNPSEYFKILMMPEEFIIYRTFFENTGMTKRWKKIYKSLNKNEKKELLHLISGHKTLKETTDLSNNKKIQRILKFYTISYKDVSGGKTKYLGANIANCFLSDEREPSLKK